MSLTWITIGLGLIFVVVLLAPFLIKRVEANLEIFLFIMGAIAASVSAVWSMHLVEEALVEPIKITAAVFLAGLLFHYFRHQIRRGVNGIIKRIAFRPFVFVVIVVLGLLSSLISAIIAALVLVEVVIATGIARRTAIKMIVIGCFAIGLGAVLTPLGEPLSTIAIAKLKGEPYNAGFFYLFDLLGWLVIPGVFAFGALAVILVGAKRQTEIVAESKEKEETLVHVAVRAGKVYLFVMALILLGGGFKPLVDLYFIHIPAFALYWANSASAVLDNATLAAAEIGPNLSELQIKSALMSLLISGGALIPGNIPNIICAGKLKIGMREWASVGILTAIVAMALYFPLVFFLR